MEIERRNEEEGKRTGTSIGVVQFLFAITVLSGLLS
jgi:hypothetical protein